MDDAAADVPKRLFIPRFPLLPLDGYVASSVYTPLRENWFIVETVEYT